MVDKPDPEFSHDDLLEIVLTTESALLGRELERLVAGDTIEEVVQKAKVGAAKRLVDQAIDRIQRKR